MKKSKRKDAVNSNDRMQYSPGEVLERDYVWKTEEEDYIPKTFWNNKNVDLVLQKSDYLIITKMFLSQSKIFRITKV